MVPEHRPTILVVDDKERNLFAMEKVLGPLDVDVVTARSGQDALRLLLHHDVAVVLMDVQMPDMDGLETASLMRSNRDTADIPIIFVTAFGDSRALARKGFQLGAVGYLVKPIEPGVLRDKVRMHLSFRSARSHLGTPG